MTTIKCDAPFFVPFSGGKCMLNAQLKPRMYKTRDAAMRYLSGHAAGTVHLVEYAPVRYGKWVQTYRSGVTVSRGYVSSCCDMWHERKTMYCPYCGAKMRGE